MFDVVERLRNANRMKEIIAVAMRFGFKEALDHADKAQRGVFDRFRGDAAADPQVARLSTGERLRRMLEELGPTFIKLGQVLSTREDLVPDWAILELRKLQDEVAPLPFDTIRAAVEGELNAPLGDVFKTFEQEPLASASLGQVHRAVLLDGTLVAVKVQRPKIDRVVERDLSVLHDLAEMFDGRIAALKHVRLPKVVEEVGHTLRDELVYTIEGRNAERVAATLSKDSRIRIPAVVWSVTTPRVLTTELFSAAKLSEVDIIPVEQRKELAERLAHFMLRQVLEEGFFHADPHSGNVLVFPDGDLGIVDWGQVGFLSRGMRESLDEIFIGIWRQDPERVADEIIHLGLASHEADVEGFRADLSRLLDRYFHMPRKALPLGKVLEGILELSYEHRIELPSDVPLLIKVLVTTEGTCMRFDPDFDLRTGFEPMAKRLMGQQLDPQQMLQNAITSLRQVNRLAADTPKQVSHILDKLEQGNLQVMVDTDVEHLAKRFGKIFNRLTLAALMIGILVGGAMMVEYSRTLGLIAFIGGVIGALYVVFTIVRNERA